ncbi:MAG TPA: D-alanyl-D-alanine carboxypeptidase [Geminocystis sp. M7585_C2015_104]|nr:D-alanyl-D-alanine carboxypeptidase [Geminocystis sp. M7585_C2015_104]
MWIAELLGFLLSLFSPQSPQKPPVIPWHRAEIFQLDTTPDTRVQRVLQEYLDTLSSQGLSSSQQGIWVQSDWAIHANHRGKIPAPAASLTKIATTIAALKTWDLEHRFLTRIYTTGNIQEGVVKGDIIVEAGGDPLFVWEEAIALANRLEKLGIKRVEGDLIVVGHWQMNFQDNPLKSGEMLKQALNAQNWSPAIEKQYREIQESFSRPQIVIGGSVKTSNRKPGNSQLLLTHQSLTLREILRLMNVYSNNHIAEALARQMGGGAKIATIASTVAKVPQNEIILVNGSWLGEGNRISPRAAARMLMALDMMLEDTNYNLGDLFPVASIDYKGTIEHRKIPRGIPCKTGTLAVVSALAGVIPTAEKGKVYFAIVNYGNNLDNLRKQQDTFLQKLQQFWTIQPIIPNSPIDVKFGIRTPS